MKIPTPAWKVFLILLVVGVGAVVTLKAVNPDRHGLSDSLATTPGYGEGPERSDAGGFSLAAPSNGSDATTIPGALLPGERPTTTVSDTVPIPYIPEQVESVCGLTRMLTTVWHGPIDARTVESRLDTVIAKLEAYSKVAPDTVKPDVEALKSILVVFGGIFEEGGKSLTYPPLVSATTAMVNGQRPYEKVASQVDHIRVVEEATCPGS